MKFRAEITGGSILALGLTLMGPWFAALPQAYAAAGSHSRPAFSYDEYATVLATYCNNRGMVNYRGLKAKRGPLGRFVASVGRLSRKTYDAWPNKDKIAFWLNLYNAFTLQAIIDNYPIKGSWLSRKRFGPQSIRHIDGVWDTLEFRVMGRPMTLNDIEHETLRKHFNEPRIHFGLVCASIGCPQLHNEPYLGEKLDAQLDDQVKVFLAAPSKFHIDRQHTGRLCSLHRGPHACPGLDRGQSRE